MSSVQARHIIQHFKNRPVLLNIIIDGFGIGKRDDTDAVFAARTPVFDRLMAHSPSTQLFAHGAYVGLTSDNDLGGSEVGHMTIGAGRIIPQGTTLIDQQIEDGSFFLQPSLVKATEQAKNTCLHLIGLLSDGNIHSNMNHWFAVIRHAYKSGVRQCRFHVLLDGRDVGIQSADKYVLQLEEYVKSLIKGSSEYDYRIASGGGREHMTMDRSKDWAKVKIGWDAHVHGRAGATFPSASEAVAQFRQKNPEIIDQDIPAFVIPGQDGKTTTINDGDSVIFINFRSDRAIEITRAFCEKNFKEFDTGRRPDVFFCGMTTYDQDTSMPAETIVSGISVSEPFGKRILEAGIRQFRLAETQKFPHVTFFFNGGYREPLDPTKEDYFVIPSDVIPSFSMKPEMKAVEIGDKAIQLVSSGKYGYGLINFANPDMVGHTGDFNAVVKAIESVDKALGRVIDAVEKAGGSAIITADHGNADEMKVWSEKKKAMEVSTKHSLNPVPLVVFDPRFNGSYKLRQNTKDNPLGLAMIAATNFMMLGMEPPADMLPSLFEI